MSIIRQRKCAIPVLTTRENNNRTSHSQRRKNLQNERAASSKEIKRSSEQTAECAETCMPAAKPQAARQKGPPRPTSQPTSTVQRKNKQTCRPTSRLAATTKITNSQSSTTGSRNTTGANRVAQCRKTYSEWRKELHGKTTALEQDLETTKLALEELNAKNLESSRELESSLAKLANLQEESDQHKAEAQHSKLELTAQSQKLERLGLDPLTCERLLVEDANLQTEVQRVSDLAASLREALLEYSREADSTAALMEEMKTEMTEPGSQPHPPELV